MQELLTMISQAGIAFAVLVAVIMYFLKKEKGYKAEIDKLQTELRNSEKDNLSALYKFTGVLEKMIENDELKNENLLRELSEMRKSIEEKLKDIKDEQRKDK